MSLLTSHSLNYEKLRSGDICEAGIAPSNKRMKSLGNSLSNPQEDDIGGDSLPRGRWRGNEREFAGQFGLGPLVLDLLRIDKLSGEGKSTGC